MNVAQKLGKTVTFNVTRGNDDQLVEGEAQIATEVPFTIIANDIELVTLSVLPSDLKELVIGFLYTSSIISNVSKVKSIWIDEKKWQCEITLESMPDPKVYSKRLYTSGCGRGVMFSTISDISNRRKLECDITLSISHILASTRLLQTSSDLHRNSGGVHTVALGTADALPFLFYDDIGRHNAVDKIIGKALLDSIDLKKCVLFTTGRISSDILHKAKRAGVGIIVSLGSPTHQVVLTAREFDMTIVGYARGKNVTIYSCPSRITI